VRAREKCGVFGVYAGGQEVHVFVTYPRIIGPCFNGIDMSSYGEIIGVINVESCEDNAFNQYDARLIETLANHSVAALRRINENDRRTRYEDKRIQFVNDNVTLQAHHLTATET
jgi:hypothetical protein